VEPHLIVVAQPPHESAHRGVESPLVQATSPRRECSSTVDRLHDRASAK
jgi:hypothetical protein